MQNWEYSVEEFDHSEIADIYELQDELDEWGKEGWELVSAQYISDRNRPVTRVFLKRPLETSSGEITVSDNEPNVIDRKLQANYKKGEAFRKRNSPPDL